MQERSYGWIPDIPDIRDYKYAAPTDLVLTALPPKVDLRSQDAPIWNQGSLGSCTGQAIGAAHQFGQRKLKAPNEFKPSALFIYYCERAMEGTIPYDAGAYIRDGLKCVAQLGVCREIDWPYIISKFAERPSKACYDDALNHQVTAYWSVSQTLTQLKGCLAEGYPIVFGFSVYDSFESAGVAQTGVVPMPGPSDRLLGGHAVMLVGYDDSTQRFLVRNSWGPDWGDKGYFTLPYQYVLNRNLAADFWTIRMVELDNEQPVPPQPEPDPSGPTSPCSMPGAIPALKAFLEGAIGYSDKMTAEAGAQATTVDMGLMFTSGFRSLQDYLDRLQKIQARKISK